MATVSAQTVLDVGQVSVFVTRDIDSYSIVSTRAVEIQIREKIFVNDVELENFPVHGIASVTIPPLFRSPEWKGKTRNIATLVAGALETVTFAQKNGCCH